MSQTLPTGLSVRVRVPASSANLGPGFDCLGMALDIVDEVSVTVADQTLVTAVGEGAGDVPSDESHLVVRAIERGLAVAGVRAGGLRVHCENRIPHSRGLGSSAAAVVAGLAVASELVAESALGQPFSAQQLVQLASEFEGHPDNAAASVLGGAVVTWTDHSDTDGAGPRFFARRVRVHADVRVTVFIPAIESSTAQTRGLLPDVVPRVDAIFNVSRAALSVVALGSEPDLLLAATDDRLHQTYRREAMPASAELVRRLRDAGHAAAISGAGPTVVVFGTEPIPQKLHALAVELGFSARDAGIAEPVGTVAGA